MGCDHPPANPVVTTQVYDRNVDARRQLTAMAHVKDTLPAWRIEPPAPADELLGYYREAEAASGVGWNYLAAINLIETRFGSIARREHRRRARPHAVHALDVRRLRRGGDIHSPHDSIVAAGRYLAANGFANDRDRPSTGTTTRTNTCGR